MRQEISTSPSLTKPRSVSAQVAGSDPGGPNLYSIWAPSRRSASCSRHGGVTDRQPENLARKKGELLIVGHVENVIVVGFFIIDSGRRLRVDAPHFALGKLALRPGKVLHVVAWKELENDLKTLLRASLAQVPSPLPEAEDLVVNFQGFRVPNSAFMVAVSAAALA